MIIISFLEWFLDIQIWFVFSLFFFHTHFFYTKSNVGVAPASLDSGCLRWEIPKRRPKELWGPGAQCILRHVPHQLSAF